jgi:hypothetical protein
MRSAVLFLVFNRPDTTAQVFEAVRAARPPRLYVAADGARGDRPGESERCAQVRRLATRVDWPCDVTTLFQPVNLGPQRGPVTAITWFFEHEEEGLILEDDILPLPSFFPYCDELLDRYRDDERVGVISGSNLISARFTPPDSYFFSRYLNVWGWAGWRRTWKHYDPRVLEWPAWRDQGGLRGVSDGNFSFEAFWRGIFDSANRRDVDWWSYQLQFACWSRGMLVTVPRDSQIINLGFGADSTHTRGGIPAYVRDSVPRSLIFPLRHPASVSRVPEADTAIGRDVHGLTLAGHVRRDMNSVKVFVRHLPVVGDFLKRSQVWVMSHAHLLLDSPRSWYRARL